MTRDKSIVLLISRAVAVWTGFFLWVYLATNMPQAETLPILFIVAFLAVAGAFAIPGSLLLFAED